MVKIALDAGHAGFGVTPGKRVPDGSMYEWDFNNAVVKYIDAELKNYENVSTIRVDDPTGKTDISLTKRTDTANKAKVNAYISVHANGFGSGGWNNVGGIETFVYITRPKEAMELATKIQNHLVKDTGRANRGVKTADFAVLRQTSMTAILAECGFMTNREEAALLKTEAYRKKCALAIVKGLVDQYKLVKKQTVKSTTTTNTSSTGGVYRLIVDGKQVIALSNYDNLANEAKKYLGKAKDIKIQKV